MKEFVKKVPLRKCVITSTQHPKSEMFRVVRDPDGNVVIDETGKTRGHGVYLTKDIAVIKQAKKKKALSHYLEVNVSDEIYDALIAKLEGTKNE